MFRFTPPIDFFSFWVGFLLSTLLCILIIRIIKILPIIRNTIQHNQEIKAAQKSRGLEHLLRIRTLRRCEESHLASVLFPLSSIYIETPLLVPQSSLNPLNEKSSQSKMLQFIPSLPDTPELLKDFPVPTASLFEVLENNKRVIILGEIGTGKTSLLSSFTSRLIEDDALPTHFKSHFPLLLHVADLNLDNLNEDNPLLNLLESSVLSIPGFNIFEVEELLLNLARNNEMLLLLDGMDEIDKIYFQKVSQWIRLFLYKYPNCRLIATGNLYFTDNLEDLGFIPVYISALNTESEELLVQKWVSSIRNILPLNSDENSKFFDLSVKWLKQESFSCNVFQLTLLIWNYLLVDKTTGSIPILIKGYLERLLNHEISFDLVTKIACEIDKFENYSIDGKMLRSIIFDNRSKDDLLNSGYEVSSSLSFKKNDQFVKSIISNLLKNGLIKERKKDCFQFSHFMILPYIISKTMANDLPFDLNIAIFSPKYDLAYRLCERTNYLTDKINLNDAPLFRNIVLISKHAQKLPDSDSVKKRLFLEIVRLLQDNSYPYSIRIRLLIAFSSSEESSIQQLLNLFSKNSNPEIRSISAFGYGIFSSENSILQLQELIKDPIIEVSSLSCISLGRIWDSRAQKILVDTFLNTSDDLRQLIAEIFAYHPGDGHEILKELTTIDDIACRKSSISGLRIIKAPWVKEFLLSISTADSQWIVRDAAVSALENLDNDQIFPEVIATTPYNSPWLLRFASNFGFGVPMDEFPIELLLRVIESGNLIEKKCAVDFLHLNPDLNVISKLIQLSNNDPFVRENAVSSLFKISRKTGIFPIKIFEAASSI